MLLLLISVLSFFQSSMLQRQIFYSERMNLCFDGSVMSGDVDVMRESICQVSMSQLVFLCYHPQFIPQNYTTCGNKYIEGHSERTKF